MKFYWNTKPQWRRHQNPDGSTGGEVSIKAKVSPKAYIEAGAVVAPGAVVDAGAHIKNGDIVLPGGGSLRLDLSSSKPASVAGLLK